MLKVVACESGAHEFDSSGTILRGQVNPHDVGLFQVSETTWLDIADKLGYNIYTAEGNIQMAKYIYEKQGIQAWNSSKWCWGKEV